MQALVASPRIGVRPVTSRNAAMCVTIGRFSSGVSARLLQTQVRAQPEQKTPPTVPGSEDELPPWVRREKERELQAKDGVSGLPWGLCLLFSVFTAIAAVGSIFEFVDRNAIFGVIQPDSPLWAPILLFFGVTGFPTAGYLFIKGVNGFNEEAERQDKLDGYL